MKVKLLKKIRRKYEIFRVMSGDNTGQTFAIERKTGNPFYNASGDAVFKDLHFLLFCITLKMTGTFWVLDHMARRNKRWKTSEVKAALENARPL